MTIENLRELEAKATPGEWYAYPDDQHGQAVIGGEHTEVATFWHHSVGSIEKQMRANALLAADSVNLVRQSLREEDALVERVAKAICASLWSKEGEDWTDASDEQRAEFRDAARAAISALLNPMGDE